jgi:hypothetical protein
MYGLTFKWRLTRIESDLAELYEKHGEDLAVKLVTATPFKICPYHVNGGNLEDKKEIKEKQKECGDYPEPNFFEDGACYHYRPATGHCDRHTWEKKEDK